MLDFPVVRMHRRGAAGARTVAMAAALVAAVASPLAAQGPPPVPPVTRTPATAPIPAVAPVAMPAPWSVLAPSAAIAPRALEEMQWRMDEMGQRAEAMAARLASGFDFAPMVHEALEHSAFAVAQAVAPMAATLASGFDRELDRMVALAPGFAVTSSSRSYRTQPPAAWAQADPADSLYREARKALSSDSYRRAADLFQKIRTQFPKSTYAADAPYWEAFALQRLGGTTELRAAMAALEFQQANHPRAATRGDAAALRTRIEGQLARGGDQQAVNALIRRTQYATSDGCPRAQDDERVDALNAVAQIDAEKAMPILKKVLARREACTQQLRRTAVWLIASKKQPEAASILLDVAKTDPDKEVREQAVFWMANVPTEEATTMLIDLARKGNDIDMQKRALYALSRSKSPRAASTLREVALDANAEVEVRSTALDWYMRGPGKAADDAMSFLKDVYGKADSREFKARIQSTIASRKDDEARAFLVDVAQNPKESMEARRSAISALRSSGVTDTQLAQIYDRGGDVEVRKQVISVLGGLRDNAGVEKLLDIARNEKNTELRKQAITYLTRSKDPRALQLLQEIIDR